MAPRLNIIVSSTRPGRAAPAIGSWVQSMAKAHGHFDAHLVDIVDFDLPMFDEPGFPSNQKYENEHTKRWAAVNEAADAFIFVLPEYNHGPPGSLVNALNYLYNEWTYKPASFASYGGVSGGLRSVSVTKLLLQPLRMIPIVDSIIIPNYFPLYKDGVFSATEKHEKSAQSTLDELALFVEPLRSIREEKQARKEKS